MNLSTAERQVGPGVRAYEERAQTFPAGCGQDAGVDVGEAVVLEEVRPRLGGVLPAQHGQFAFPAFEPLAVHWLRSVGAGGGFGLAEGEDPAGCEVPGDEREEELGVGEPHRAPHRVDRVEGRRAGGEVVAGLGVDELQAGGCPSTTGGRVRPGLRRGPRRSWRHQGRIRILRSKA